MTGGTVSGLITSTTSNTSAAFYKSSSTGTAFARIGAATYDKGFGVSNTGDLIFGDWSSVSTLSSSWDKVYHTGNLNLTTLSGVPTSRTLTTGNGLTGGGNLTANRTFTLGTPSTLTAATTNAVTAESHTHAIDGSSLVVLESNRLNVPDTRSVDSLPSSIPSKTITAFFKTNAIVNAPPVTTGSSYAHILNMNGYNSGNTGGGGHTTQLAFGDSLAIRQSTSTTA